jgi:hypothetical protein
MAKTEAKSSNVLGEVSTDKEKYPLVPSIIHHLTDLGLKFPVLAFQKHISQSLGSLGQVAFNPDSRESISRRGSLAECRECGGFLKRRAR